jgi:hypothetical protein
MLSAVLSVSEDEIFDWNAVKSLWSDLRSIEQFKALVQNDKRADNIVRFVEHLAFGKLVLVEELPPARQSIATAIETSPFSQPIGAKKISPTCPICHKSTGCHHMLGDVVI